MFTDTHTHLYLPDFKDDLDTLLSEAFNNNIKRFYLPNIDSSTIEPMLELCRSYPDKIFPMIGLHPCSVKNNFEEELIIVEQYLKTFSRENVSWTAIGEIGLDLYWDKSTLPQQEIAFRKQVELAGEYNLPIVIHSRNSTDEIYNILVEIRDKNPLAGNKIRGIFHCFSGTAEQAQKIIEFGNFKLGIGGVVTFKNAGLDKVVGEIDLKHIVLETDAPYLAPVPFRGKRNEPKYLIEIAKKIAEIKNVSLATVAEITTNNSMDVFGN